MNKNEKYADLLNIKKKVFMKVHNCKCGKFLLNAVKISNILMISITIKALQKTICCLNNKIFHF